MGYRSSLFKKAYEQKCILLEPKRGRVVRRTVRSGDSS